MLLLYLAISKLLLAWTDKRGRVITFTSLLCKALQEEKARYPDMEKLIIALVIASQKLQL